MRSFLLVALVALVASIASAQQPVSSTPAQQAGNERTAQPSNPFLATPYGAKDAQPVSRWTPPASVGRQLTLNDLLTWKQIRTPILSNTSR